MSAECTMTEATNISEAITNKGSDKKTTDTCCDNNHELESINNNTINKTNTYNNNNNDTKCQQLSSPETGSQRRTSVTFVQSADDPSFHKPKLQRTPTPFHEICLSESKSPSTSQDGDCIESDNKDGEIKDSDGGNNDNINRDDQLNKMADEYEGITMTVSIDSKMGEGSSNSSNEGK